MKNIAIAVDLGATNLRVALVDKRGKIVEKFGVATPSKGRNGKAVTNRIVETIKKLNFKKKDILGIGISSIGPLDYKKGGVINPPNLPFSFIPLVSPLKDKFSLDVTLFRDCAAGAWGEKCFGSCKKAKNIVYITISSGIGGGAIVDNHLLFGKDGNAVEVGHLIVDNKYGLLCSCKKGYGHWEGLCSGNNLPKFFVLWQKRKNFKRIIKIEKAKEIFSLAQKNNQKAMEFIREAGKINARAISDINCAYNPEIVVFGGSVVLNNKKFIIPQIKEGIEKYLRTPKIKVTSLEEDVCLLGAAATVFWKAM